LGKDKLLVKIYLIFCYILDDEKSIPWKQWNLVKKFNEKFIGAVNIPNARDTYALFYDRTAEMIHSETFTSETRDIKKFLKKLVNQWVLGIRAW
jgi:hypothetical protein